MGLVREDWDFSKLPARELEAALSWEILRECQDVHEIVANARLWLEDRLSKRKRPLSREQRRLWRRRNPKLSEAEKASLQACAVFDDFIPIHEFNFLHHWTLVRRREEFDRWQAKQLRPLVWQWNLPWLHLSDNERQRLCSILENSGRANIVHVGSWWDAIGYLERERLDRGLPLKFHYSNYTTVLLTINRRFSRKRILTAISTIVDDLPSDGIARWSARGRKKRDLLVALERIAMMRLLHYFTLSELPIKIPEAWRLYERRKWYDERRQALKDFRRRSPYSEPEKFFPLSWETKAQRSRKA